MDNLQFNNTNQPVQNDNKKNIVKYVGIGVAAVVAIVILVALVGALLGGGYKGAIKNQIKLINKRVENSLDYQEKSRFASEAEMYELIAKYSNYYDAEYRSSYAETLGVLEDYFGDNFKVKYKITDSNKMDKDDVEDIQEYFEDEYDRKDSNDSFDNTWDNMEKELEDTYKLSSKEIKNVEKKYDEYVKEYKKIKITEIYEVELEVTVKGNKEKDDFDLDLLVAKVNGEWVFLQEKKYDNGDEVEKSYYFTSGITPRTIYNEFQDDIFETDDEK